MSGETATGEGTDAGHALRDHFIGWQCRIRQMAMRQSAGRPTPGMRPRLLLPDGRELAPAVSVVIVPADPEESTDFFRHQVRKTHDPNLVYERGLQYLQSTHFQNARRFADRLTALFGGGSDIVRAVLGEGRCILEFSQFSQTYRMLCTVRELDPEDAFYQATYWHNRIFNPDIPGDIHILAFQPDWRSVQADPAP